MIFEPERPLLQEITKPAFVQARLNLSDQAFLALNQEAIGIFYDQVTWSSPSGHPSYYAYR